MNKLLPQPDPINRLPIAILLIKSNCNCRCSMCDIWLDTKRQELSEPAITELLPQLNQLGTSEIVLSGGEPLMHTEIDKICRTIKSWNFKLTLLSTGLLLKRHAVLVSECVDQIYVSLDGPETIHNTIRNIPDAYGKLMSGIRAVRQLDPEKKIGGRSTVHRQNFRYLSETVKAAEELGLDSISFLAADIQAGNFGRQKNWNENGLALRLEELEELRAALNHLYHEHAEGIENGFIVESKEKLERKLYGYYQAIAGQGDFPPVRCNAPWVSTVIETNGSVRPCFFHRPFAGNATKLPLPEILNSDQSRNWRQQLDVSSDTVCRSCVCSLAFAGN